MPTISIIVPVYKVEPYLRRCVDSILAQTFADFELILVDDGSPDSCGAICDEYAKKDGRVRVIHKKNGGVSSSRNAGLNVAQGEYIMFCDGDDYVADNWCAELYSTIKEHPSALVCSDLERVYEDNIGISSEVYHPSKEETTESNIHISYFELYKKGLSGFLVNKIFKHKTIITENLHFDSRRRIGEDAEFCAKYCQYCTSYLFVPKKLYYYVQHQESAMHQYYVNWMELHIPTFSWRLPLIQDTEVPEFCDIWVGTFIHLFNHIFDPRCELSLLQKLQYNQKMMNTEEVRYCFTHASGKNENPLVMIILRTHNYYLFWLFDQLIKLKRKLRRKTK